MGLWVLCLDHCSFKEPLSRSADYSFHFYLEVCQFVYCLLSRTRQIGSLPDLSDWKEYMDVEKIDEFERISSGDYLRNHPFGSTLQSRNDGSRRTFLWAVSKVYRPTSGRNSGTATRNWRVLPRTLCLLFGIVGWRGWLPYVGSFLQIDPCIRVKWLRLVIWVKDCWGVLGYSTFVVDARRRHGSCGASAEDFADVRHYLLSDCSYLSRKTLSRFFRLCCLVALKPSVDYPFVDIDLTNCQVSEWVIAACVSGVQSSDSGADFKLGSFFTKLTMKEVPDLIDASRSFMSNAGFDPWARLHLKWRSGCLCEALISAVTDLSSPLFLMQLVMLCVLVAMMSLPQRSCQTVLRQLCPLLLCLDRVVLSDRVKHWSTAAWTEEGCVTWWCQVVKKSEKESKKGTKRSASKSGDSSSKKN